jgi:hypothetical protein
MLEQIPKATKIALEGTGTGTEAFRKKLPTQHFPFLFWVLRRWRNIWVKAFYRESVAAVL